MTNAWRAQQILQLPIDPEIEFSVTAYRKGLVNHCASLTDFNYKLAVALIESLVDPYFQNILVANPNRTAAESVNEIRLDVNLGIARDPATLWHRI